MAQKEKLTKGQVQQVVNKVNELLDKDDQIKGNKNQLIEGLKQAANEVLEPEDVEEFSSDEMSTLNILGISVDANGNWQVKEPKNEEDTQEEEQQNEPEQADEQENEEAGIATQEIRDEVNGAENLKALREVAKNYDVFKSYRSELSSYKKVEKLREKMLKSLEGEEEEKPAEEKSIKKTINKNGKATLNEIVEFLTPFIEKGGYTKKELIEKAAEEYPEQRTSIATILTDGKNPKYSKFPKLIIQENEELAFKSQIDK